MARARHAAGPKGAGQLARGTTVGVNAAAEARDLIAGAASIARVRCATRAGRHARGPVVPRDTPAAIRRCVVRQAPAGAITGVSPVADAVIDARALIGAQQTAVRPSVEIVACAVPDEAWAREAPPVAAAAVGAREVILAGRQRAKVAGLACVAFRTVARPIAETIVQACTVRRARAAQGAVHREVLRLASRARDTRPEAESSAVEADARTGALGSVVASTMATTGGTRASGTRVRAPNPPVARFARGARSASAFKWNGPKTSHRGAEAITFGGERV
jgi:hypothetical protein